MVISTSADHFYIKAGVFVRKLLIYMITGFTAWLLSYSIIHWIAFPTLTHYQKLARVMARYEYTELTLIVFLSLSLWLFYFQFSRKKISVIYLYLVYSVYLFLLFVVLFAKASHYHSLSLDPFDFFVKDKRIIMEAFLNVLYFIPLGALYGLKTRIAEFVFASLITIIGIETLQYVFYVGTFAISDILLNWLGCIIGYWICRFLRSQMKVI